MTTIAVPTDTPEIVCPFWCTSSYAEHLADLALWDGFVFHHGPERNGVGHTRCAFPDGTIAPDDPPRVYLPTICDGLPLDDAEALARQILAAVEEARS